MYTFAADSLDGYRLVTVGVIVQKLVVAAQAAVTGFPRLGNHQGHLLEEAAVNHTASVAIGQFRE